MAGVQDVVQVAQQPIAHVQGAAGNAAQRLAQGHARGGRFQALAGLGQDGGRQHVLALQRVQRQAGIAQGAADPDIVAHLGTAAQNGLAAGHFPKHGDADGERPLRGVAADEFAVVGFGQGEQPFAEGLAPGLVAVRQGQGQGKGQGLGPAGGQVRQIDGQRLVAQQAGGHVGQKVAALHQHVAGDGQLHAGARGQQGAVVAHAQGAAVGWALKEALNEVKFAQGLLHKGELSTL